MTLWKFALVEAVDLSDYYKTDYVRNGHVHNLL